MHLLFKFVVSLGRGVPLRNFIVLPMRIVVTAALCHGWFQDFFLSHENLAMGANGFCEVICRVLDKMFLWSQVSGRKFPRHLCLQADNTVAQAKNHIVGGFLALLVGSGRLASVTLNFLLVGHTHEDVDQVFALLCRRVLLRTSWETLEDLQSLIAAGMCTGSRSEVHYLNVVGDFEGWLDAANSTQTNCWGTRRGIEAPHSFIYKRRCDLTAAETRAVEDERQRSAVMLRLAPDPHDVFCCVKTYMKDLSLQQAPVMVLPKQRCQNVVSRSPVERVGVEISGARQEALLRLAEFCGSAQCGYLRARQAIRDLIASAGAPPPLQPYPWLSHAPAQDYEPIEQTANLYFNHLPQTSWKMLANFRRRAAAAAAVPPAVAEGEL